MNSRATYHRPRFYSNIVLKFESEANKQQTSVHHVFNLRSLQVHVPSTTLAFLVENVHAITPNQDIDRSVPRCKLCDLLAAQQRADLADKLPPTFESLVDKIERDITLTQDLIGEGIRKDELEKALEVMKKQLNDAVMEGILGDLGSWGWTR